MCGGCPHSWQSPPIAKTRPYICKHPVLFDVFLHKEATISVTAKRVLIKRDSGGITLLISEFK